jgi:hypothetical protein
VICAKRERFRLSSRFPERARHCSAETANAIATTDNDIDVASLVVDDVKRTETPVTLPPSPLIALKDEVWLGVRNAVSQ